MGVRQRNDEPNVLACLFDLVLTHILFLYKNPLFDLVCLVFFVIFCYIFFFLEERDIKWKVIYIFTLDFNKGGLRNPNKVKHTWAKC